MIHPLEIIVSSLRDEGRREDAYKPPIAKTMIKKYFCFLGSCRDLSAGIGKMQIAISDTMLKVALVNQNAIKFTQWPPWVALSQKYATGRQTNMLPETVAAP